MIVIFDIEASCEDRTISSTYNMETIEIGAVKIKDKKVIDEFQTFIEPEYVDKLTNYCTNLTGIKYEDLEGAPKFAEAILAFNDFIKGCEIYSCGNFDKKFLTREIEDKCNSYEHELVSNTIETSHFNLKTFYSQVTGNKKGSMLQMAGKLNIRLDGELHRGIDDARNLAKIFIKLEEIRESNLRDKFEKRFSDIVKYVGIHHEDYEITVNDIENITVINSHGDISEYSFLSFIDMWAPVMITDIYERGLKYLDSQDLSHLRRFSRLWY